MDNCYMKMVSSDQWRHADRGHTDTRRDLVEESFNKHVHNGSGREVGE